MVFCRSIFDSAQRLSLIARSQASGSMASRKAASSQMPPRCPQVSCRRQMLAYRLMKLRESSLKAAFRLRIGQCATKRSQSASPGMNSDHGAGLAREATSSVYSWSGVFGSSADQTNILIDGRWWKAERQLQASGRRQRTLALSAHRAMLLFNKMRMPREHHDYVGRPPFADRYRSCKYDYSAHHLNWRRPHRISSLSSSERSTRPLDRNTVEEPASSGPRQNQPTYIVPISRLDA